MLYRLKRPAVAMIELIFAIVIMGIVISSAPMLISTASSTTVVALQQEAINEAATKVNMILTYPWDQSDVTDSCIPPVLHVTAGDSELNEYANTKRRVGIPTKSNSRTFACGNRSDFNASAIAKDGLDDIDDFSDPSNPTSLVTDASGSGGVDYIEQSTVNISTTVSYINDSATYSNKTFAYNIGGTVSSGTTNIKLIQVTLTSSSSESELNQKNITLKAFSCNIGGIEYESRSF